MKIIQGNQENFTKEVLEAKTKVIVDFNAQWCGPCRMLAPILEEVAETTEHKIVAVDVDTEMELAKKYGSDDAGRYVNGILAALQKSMG